MLTTNTQRSAVFLFVSLVAVAVHAEGIKDVTLESPTHGTTLTLSEQKGKVIVLHFLLKTECPYCLKYTREYAKLAGSNHDVLHLFLKPDSVDEIKAWSLKLGPQDLKDLPVIYRDPDARLATQLGIPDGYKFHGETVHFPALVVLDSAGQELFRYVGKNNSDRMKPDDFSAKLKSAMKNQAK
ncbi:TlpA family protein disulfide reductase [Schlesneria paludicola]|uniref:TlpA family protein disulfide reductase n=1 Tax=Schlesneria paludicola TaxID=360056 RepID=UPI0012F9F0F7|nr:TlpA disulfide reductase family protein [Schlesneria paludicola]